MRYGRDNKGYVYLAEWDFAYTMQSYKYGETLMISMDVRTDTDAYDRVEAPKNWFLV